VQAGGAGQRGKTLSAKEQEADVATVTELGQTGLQGWREKVADGISQPVANRAPLEEDQVRAVIGAAFFVLAVIYVTKTISAATRRARQG
jgi:predicted secreted protein